MLPRWSLLLPVLALSGADDTAASEPPPLIFEGDFETEATGTGRLGSADRAEALARTRVVTTPVRAGRHALEVTLDRASGAHRTDFYLTDIGGRFRVGRAYWFGFSTWIPADWQPDLLNELFVQWVRTTRKVSGPQLALYVRGADYVLTKRWDPQPEGPKDTVRSEDLWRGAVPPDRGKWVDWVLHVKWALDERGFLRLWKNGELVIQDKGPNCYADAGGKAPYFKFGIYKWPWRRSAEEAPGTVTRRRVVFDEIRIGSAAAGFAAVSPTPR